MVSFLPRGAWGVCLVLAGCGAPAPDSAGPAPTTTAPEPAPATAEPVRAVAALKEAGADEPAAAPTPAETAFACNGADPAWSLQVSPEASWLRLPEGDTTYTGELRRTSTGAYTWLGVPADDPAQTVALLLAPDHCFPADGSAALPYSAELGLADGRQLDGCCQPSPGD